MTEPVAYRFRESNKTYSFIDSRFIGTNPLQGQALYTAEQLHPRVKMTKKQYDRLMWDKENTDLSTCLEYFINSDGNNDFGLPSENLRGDLTQDNIAQAWLNPEETIEIVPNMKWFVRVDSQIPLPDENIYLDDELIVYPHYDSPKSSAHKFDTKEEAEKWTNPLTEAVQLPVEDE